MCGFGRWLLAGWMQMDIPSAAQGGGGAAQHREASRVLMPPALPQTTSSTLKGAIQLGIGYTVGNLSSKPERDVLMQDFYVVESIFFPR